MRVSTQNLLWGWFQLKFAIVDSFSSDPRLKLVSASKGDDIQNSGDQINRRKWVQNHDVQFDWKSKLLRISREGVEYRIRKWRCKTEKRSSKWYHRFRVDIRTWDYRFSICQILISQFLQRGWSTKFGSDVTIGKTKFKMTSSTSGWYLFALGITVSPSVQF